MGRVVIIGAGSHGRDVAEVLRCQAEQGADVHALGFIDDDSSLRGRTIDGLPVLGDWTWFDGVDRGEVKVICASGFSETRRLLVERASAIGLSFANAIFPLAYITPRAKIGEGVMIHQGVIVCRDTLIGDHAIINTASSIGHDTELGRYATVNPAVNLAGHVSIGEGCFLGIGCSVIQGIRIGAWTTVGAGAAVIRDLPGGVTAVGVPAKIIKTREEAG